MLRDIDLSYSVKTSRSFAGTRCSFRSIWMTGGLKSSSSDSLFLFSIFLNTGLYWQNIVTGFSWNWSKSSGWFCLEIFYLKACKVKICSISKTRWPWSEKKFKGTLFNYNFWWILWVVGIFFLVEELTKAYVPVFVLEAFICKL